VCYFIKKSLVFRFNPALQAFPPSHLGIVQTSLLSALGLASVPFSRPCQGAAILEALGALILLRSLFLLAARQSEQAPSALGLSSVPFSRPCHGAAILGVTGGGRSALTGGAPAGRLLGCALSFQLSALSSQFSVLRFPFSRPCHGAAILGVTGGGRSALTGGAPVGRLLGCAEGKLTIDN